MEIRVHQSSLFYHVEGQGPEALLIFHGFGQHHGALQHLARAVGDRYTCYLFDLFYHGRSVWQQDDTPLAKTQWKDIMDIFLQQNNLTRFAVAGYSLGGKFALATFEAFPDRTTHVFLLAADGITLSPWYQLATGPLRHLFKSLIDRPQPFFGIIRMLRLLRVVNDKLLNFAARQMETRDHRYQVYHAWVVFRQLRFDIKSLAALVRRYDTRFVMVTGRYDQVVPPKRMSPFTRLVPQAHHHVLDTGHQGVLLKASPYILRMS